MKILLYIGFLCVGFGVVGIFIPLIPTTPFLLAAIWFFMRSDPRYKQKLLDHRYLGPYIRGYFNGEKLSSRQKWRTLTLLWFTLILSGVFFTSIWWVRLLLFIIGSLVTLHIIKLNRRKAEPSNPLS